MCNVTNCLFKTLLDKFILKKKKKIGQFVFPFFCFQNNILIPIRFVWGMYGVCMEIVGDLIGGFDCGGDGHAD